MKRMRVLLICFGIVLFAIQLLNAQRYPIHEIGINAGLPQSVVYHVFQDSKGFIWFSTQDGVAKFDGVQFSYFSLTEGLIDNMARQVNEDDKGIIWIATDRGISLYNEKKQYLDSYPFFEGKGVRSLLFHQGTMLIGTVNEGLYAIREDSILFHIGKEHGLAHNRVYSITVKNDTAYIGTDVGLSLIALNNWKNAHIVKTYNATNGLINNAIRSVIVVNNQIWSAGYGGGINILDNGVFTRLDNNNGLPETKINELFFDEHLQTVWVASDGSGLYRIGKNNSITIINESLGLSNNSLQSIFKDRESNLWMGTWGSGVFRLRHTNTIMYDRFSGLPENNVTAVYAESDNGVWIGTNNKGLIFIKGSEKKYVNKETDVIRTNRIFCITGSGNSIYVGTDIGLYQIKEKKVVKSLFSQEKDRVSVRSIFVDKDNNIWLGLFGKGVVQLSPDLKLQNWYSRKNGLLNDSVFAITQLKSGEILIGTDGGVVGLNQFSINKTLTTKEGLLDNRVSSIMEDQDGNIWVGTYKSGLTVFKRDTVLYYSQKNGLLSNLISFINQDDDGSIWIGTKKGVSKFIGDSLKLYTTQNGLISNEVNSNASFFRNNKLYIGTVSGLSVLDLSEPEVVETNSPVYIKKTMLWGQHYAIKSNSVLEHNQNFITLEFTSPHFSNPELLTFEYRLLGLENDWNQSKQRLVQYTNLSPKTYSFQVRTITATGLKNENPTELTFTILPAFWQTASFRISVFGIVIFLVYIGIRIKSKRLQIQNEYLESEVKKRTEELEKREELFRIVSENAGDLIVVSNNCAKVQYASPSFLPILGIHPTELVGQYIGSLVSEASIETYNEIMHSVFDEKSPVKTAEIELYTKTKQLKTFIITISLVEHSVKRNKQYVLVGHDISSRKETEKELIQSKLDAEAANLAKSRFLASMSHELRTPLNAILGFAQILENAPDLPRQYRDYVQIMHNSGEHLLSMINDILDLSKIEAGRMEVNISMSSLLDFLRDLENMMLIQARKNNLSLVFEKAPTLPDYIKTDFNKIRQVLINLIGNAIKYTEIGGVTVVIQESEPEYLTFEIRDTGPGIPAEQIEKIFDAFQQVHTENFSKGTGLGLTISMKIAQLLGGKITVTSQVGKGSVFTFHLPITVIPQEEIPSTSSLTSKIRHLKKGTPVPTLLIVDDVDENRSILTEFLRQIGFTCFEFNAAKSALEQLSTINPDLILTDIIMPEMDGKEFLSHIRANPIFASIPVIAVTASIFAETRVDLIQQGFNEFILKPINFDVLLKQIRSFINVEYEVESTQDSYEKQNSEEQLLIQDFNTLPESLKAELWDALELLDEESLEQLVYKLPSNSTLKTELTLAVEQKNYRFILNLTEKLNHI